MLVSLIIYSAQPKWSQKFWNELLPNLMQYFSKSIWEVYEIFAFLGSFVAYHKQKEICIGQLPWIDLVPKNICLEAHLMFDTQNNLHK